LVSGWFTMILAGLIFAGDAAEGQSTAFPSYGSGPIEVRIYSDYFCPPCRAMKPTVDPILKDLLKKNLIRLTLVDTPFNPHTPLFSRYFLSALQENNDVDHVFRVRNILFEASTNKSITTKERIEGLFKEKDIPYATFDAKSTFKRFNVLFKEDKIKETPTCVIIIGGEKKKFTKGPDIVNALKSLHE